jgi:hypothetical protein
MRMLIRRLRFAWKLRMFPWDIPSNVIRFVSFEKATVADIKRTKELAERFGWEA